MTFASIFRCLRLINTLARCSQRLSRVSVSYNACNLIDFENDFDSVLGMERLLTDFVGHQGYMYMYIQRSQISLDHNIILGTYHEGDAYRWPQHPVHPLPRYQHHWSPKCPRSKPIYQASVFKINSAFCTLMYCKPLHAHQSTGTYIAKPTSALSAPNWRRTSYGTPL